jgi:predicted DNA-binding transcriptional regulator AlpA
MVVLFHQQEILMVEHREQDEVPGDEYSIPALLGPDAVASRLRISRRTLERLVAADKLPEPIRFGQRCVRWLEQDVVRALERLKGERE